MERYLEIYKNKRFEEIGRRYTNYFIAEMLLDDFRYCTYIIYTMLVDIHNFNNLYKLVEGYDTKKLVSILKSIVKHQGVNNTPYVANRFLKHFTDFGKDSKEIFTTDFKEEYKTGADILNSLSTMILFCEKEYKVVLNTMSFKEEFSNILDLIVDFMILIKDKIKTPKISKYQKYAGMNLKHWRVANGN